MQVFVFVLISDMNDEILIDNGFGDEGIEQLSEVLKANSSLTQLDLQGTQ